jgi:PKD repeat protein
LTPTNAGGDGTELCQNVTISEVPSTSLNAGDKIDLNGDGVNDLQAYTCNCPASMGLSVLNFAEWGSVGKAYSAVTLSDAQNASYGTSGFVQENGDYNSPSVIRTGTGALVKMWAPVNDNGTVRLQVEVLAGGGTPPDAPVASFTATPSGLNVNFTDTSTNTPTSWAWDFDDTGTSTSRNPSHTFADTGTFNVCLTAANAGGSDTACQNVSVTKSGSRGHGRLGALNVRDSEGAWPEI